MADSVWFWQFAVIHSFIGEEFYTQDEDLQVSGSICWNPQYFRLAAQSELRGGEPRSILFRLHDLR
jgi:hypothetical protein